MKFSPKVDEKSLLARIPWSDRPVSRSLDVGPGWYQLIWDLVDDLNKFECDYTVDQVKEKFGTLSFYYTTIKHGANCAGEWSECPIFNRVRIAESATASLCEECGERGKVRSHSWACCLCDACDAEWHASRDEDEDDC